MTDRFNNQMKNSLVHLQQLLLESRQRAESIALVIWPSATPTANCVTTVEDEVVSGVWPRWDWEEPWGLRRQCREARIDWWQGSGSLVVKHLCARALLQYNISPHSPVAFEVPQC